MADSHDDRSERLRPPSDNADRHRDRPQRDLEDDRRSRWRDYDRESSRRKSPRHHSHSRTRGEDDRDYRKRERLETRDRRDEPASHLDDDRRRRNRSPRRNHRSPRRSHRSDRREDRDRDDKRVLRRRRSPRSRSHSPRRRSPRRSPSPPKGALQRRGPLPSQSDAFTRSDMVPSGDGPPIEKQKPNFNNSGRLAAESNTVRVPGGANGQGQGIVLKYHEPPEARKPPPKEPWRIYVFKGPDMLEMVELGGRSCWLLGREHLVVDFPLEHPSCSKQHAALQFRFVEKKNEYGDKIGKVKPYLIDLESANGSSLNGDPVPAGRYVEVRDKDVLRFGLSSREYVMMLPPS